MMEREFNTNKNYAVPSPVVDENEDELPTEHHNEKAKFIMKTENSPASKPTTKTSAEDGRYGWSCFKPDCLQFLNRPSVFMISLCLIVFGQGLACTGINNTMITSIEKRYGFKTTEIGVFSTLFHTSAGVFVSIVCYFGHRHRPLALGLACLSIALGLFVITIPHYMISKYEAGVALITDTCRKSLNSTDSGACQQTTNDKSKYFSIFVLGYVLMGLGVTPLYSLGYAHINDIVGRGKGSIYLGIVGTVASIGPAAGFMLGNPIVNVFVDLVQPKDSNLTPENRNWVGAWWLGYLIGAGILVLASIPMFGFPKLFSNSEAVKAKKSGFVDAVSEDKDLNNDLKSLWPSTKSLLTNVPFLMVCIANGMEGLVLGGFAGYFPKIIETQFHYTAGQAAFLTGAIAIPGASVGMVLGAYLCKRFRWNCKQLILRIGIFSFCSMILVSSSLIGCDGRSIVGSDVPYRNQSSISLNADCNKFCQCSTRYYKPVCSVVDQQTFYSPCHAGCSNINSFVLDGVKTFRNCSCVAGNQPVKSGRCKPECKLMPVAMTGIFLFLMFCFMTYVPTLNIVFRLVPEGQGSYATGIMQLCLRFLGLIPAPTVFGRLIDESCKLWHKDECTGEKTSCLEYENKDFRLYIFILAISGKVIALIFIFVAYKSYQLPKQQNSIEMHGNFDTKTTKEDTFKEIPLD